MRKTKSVALILGVLVMSFLVGYLAFAWTEPTASPPGGNVLAPLNVGTTNQIKAGGLGIVGAFYADPPTLVVDAVNHRVGIGTASPGAKLEVAGQIKITDGSQGANKVLTSDAAGLASWQTPVSAGGAPVGASYVVMALDGILTAERRLTTGTGITISDGGANSNVTVGLSYPSKSCGSGYTIQSFNMGSSAAPTCVAVGGGGGGVSSVTGSNGITASPTTGAVGVSLTYPSKSCGAGTAIQSLNVGSSAAPTCVAVGGGGGGGDITDIFGGIGISVANSAGPQPTVSVKNNAFSCGTSNRSLKSINIDTGAVTCETDDVGATQAYVDSKSLSCYRASSATGCVSCASGYTMTGGGCWSGYACGLGNSYPSGNGWCCSCGSTFCGNKTCPAAYVVCCRII